MPTVANLKKKITLILPLTLSLAFTRLKSCNSPKNFFKTTENLCSTGGNPPENLTRRKTNDQPQIKPCNPWVTRTRKKTVFAHGLLLQLLI